MKLYYTKGACSLACRIIINEIGLSADYISVDLKKKLTENNEDFAKINPKGAVPTLLTDNNEILTENAVIQQYLADISNSTQLLPAVGNLRRYHVLEWLNYIGTEIHKGFTPFFYPQFPEEVIETIFLPALKKKFIYLDHALKDKNYLMGNDFTLPDAYLFVMLTWALNFKLPLADWSNLTRYFNELRRRKSISQSLEEERIHHSTI